MKKLDPSLINEWAHEKAIACKVYATALSITFCFGVSIDTAIGSNLPSEKTAAPANKTAKKSPPKKSSKLSGKSQLVGRWKCGAIDGDIVVFDNGTLTKTAHDKAYGSWVFHDGWMRIRWSNGWWSDLHLSKDGKTLNGRAAWDENTTNGKHDYYWKISDKTVY